MLTTGLRSMTVCNFFTWVILLEAPVRSPTPTEEEVSGEEPPANTPGPLKQKRSEMTSVFPDKMDESL